MSHLGPLGDTSRVKESDMNTGGGQYPEIAPGWYSAALVSDKVQKKGWGTGLQLQFQIDEGEYEGGKFSDYLCIQHHNEETQHIARIRLRELATAAGHPTPDDVQDTDPLMGVPIMVRIYRQAAKDPKYAASDGTEQSVGEYLSVADWRAKHTNGSDPRAAQPSHSTVELPSVEPPPPGDSDSIPF